MTMPRHGATLADVVVLMPVFNGHADAWRTLASIVEPCPVRVLVVDDGSSPPFSVAEAQAPLAAGVTVEVLRLAPNGGIERALAAGVAALLAEPPIQPLPAGGPDMTPLGRIAPLRYIARIDAGDLSVPSRLVQQRAFLDAHPGVGALGMWARAKPRSSSAAEFTMAPPTDPEVIRRLRFARSCFVHPSMMLRADAVRRAGNYRDAYPAAEDLDLFLRIMQTADCANLPQIGVIYELNASGISASRRRTQIISTLRLQFAYFEPSNPYYWLGLLKNLLHLVTPYWLLQQIKRSVL